MWMIREYNQGSRSIKVNKLNNYDRMKAKKVPGQHCRFCGDPSVPLIKTKCCNEFICCDKKTVSFRGGGFCQFEHEHNSMCYFHYSEKHSGEWETCQECQTFWKETQGQYIQGEMPKKKLHETPKDRNAAKIYRSLFNGI